MAFILRPVFKFGLLQITLGIWFHHWRFVFLFYLNLCVWKKAFILKHESHYIMCVVFAADDHDVLHFLTTSLHPPGQAQVSGGGIFVSDEEQRKLSQEYADYQRKLEQQKEEYVTGYCVVLDT